MKKKIYIIAAVVFVLIIAIFGSIFAFTSAAEMPMPKAYILEVKGQAERKIMGAATWTEIQKDQEVHEGDAIRTGADGLVVINFYDASTSRIAADSEVNLVKVFLDQKNYAKQQIRLKTSTGRIWSRVLQLMDRESSYEIQSNKTVATVRGTAFDFNSQQEQQTEVDVTESVVDVATFSDDEQTNGEGEPTYLHQQLIGEGQETVVDESSEQSLQEFSVQNIPDEKKNSAWFQDNLMADQEFEKMVRERKEELLKEMSSILPDSPLYGLKRRAESIRMAMATDQSEKVALSLQFAQERLTEVQQLAMDPTKTDLALQTMNEFQTALQSIPNLENNLLPAQIDPMAIQLAKENLRNQVTLFQDVLRPMTPDQAGYDIKAQLEQLEMDRLAATPEERNFVQLRQAQERLYEARILQEQGNQELANQQIQKFEQTLEPLRQDPTMQTAVEQIETKRETIFSDYGFENPVGYVSGQQTDQSIVPLPGAPIPGLTDLDPKPFASPSPSTTNPSLPANPAAQPVTTNMVTENPKFTRLRVWADFYSLQINQQVQFHARAVFDDGKSTDNVTRDVVWVLDGNIGSIDRNGVLTVDADGGYGRVTARWRYDGKVHTQQAEQDISANVAAGSNASQPGTTKTIQNLIITHANSQNRVYSGDTLQFDAKVVFSDGSNEIINNQVTWSTTGYLGSLNSSGLLSANKTQPFSVGIVNADWNSSSGENFHAQSPVMVVEQRGFDSSQGLVGIHILANHYYSQINDPIQLTVVAIYADGSIRNANAWTTWTINDSHIGALNNGIYTANQVGQATITVSLTHNSVTKTDTSSNLIIANQPATAIDVARPLELIIVSADGYSFLPGTNVQMLAYLVKASGSMEKISDTYSLNWNLTGDLGAILPSGRVEIDDDGGQGQAQAGFNSSGSYLHGTSPIIVSEPPVSRVPMSLEIVVPRTSFNLGSGEHFQALVTYSDATTADVTTKVIWSVTGGLGNVDATGYFSTMATGNGTVSAELTESGVTVIAPAKNITVLPYTPGLP